MYYIHIFHPFLFFFFIFSAAHRDLHFSLHDALPIFPKLWICADRVVGVGDESLALPHVMVRVLVRSQDLAPSDRKSTRLNSSHTVISYAVFCLKKKKKKELRIKKL